MMLTRIAGLVTLAALWVGVSAARSQDNDAARRLVQTVVEKQKTRPFWFRLRSITFGYVPYVFEVKSEVIKYDGKGNATGSGGATGVFTPVNDVLLYTPLTMGGRLAGPKAREEWERKRDEALAASKARSESDKAKMQAAQQKELNERALFWDEFMK